MNVRPLVLAILGNCLGGVAMAELPPIRNVDVIPIELPKNFIPDSCPAKPVDQIVRVALILPKHNPWRTSTYQTPVEWDRNDVERVTKVDRIILNVADPAAVLFPKIIRRLYPRTDVVDESASLEKFDLVLNVTIQSRTRVRGNVAIGVDALGEVVAHSPDGRFKSNITAAAGADYKLSTYWSNRARARDVGVPAMQEMLGQLVRNLIEDQPLIDYLQQLRDERARPSDLATTITFDDSAALFPDGRLDAGETANLRLKIRNRGPGPAFTVSIRIASAAPGIVPRSDTVVGDIAAGAEKDVLIPISAALDIAQAAARLTIDTTEKRGYGGRQIVLELATTSLRRPTLEIADFSLSDSGPQTEGDGDGRPSNGEVVEAVILLRNAGPGDAAGATVSVSSTVEGLEIAEPEVVVGRLPANAVKEIRVPVRLPVTYSGRQVGLAVHALEKRGPTVATTNKIAVWEVLAKRPAIEIAHRMYDGNSPASAGDRDGFANNGETIELVLIPMNRGSLAARGLTLAVAPQDTGITVTPNRFAPGDLPARSDGAEYRLRLQLPRFLGRDAVLDKVRLAVTIQQRDFPPITQSITVPFNARRPMLTASLNATGPLTEGTSAVLALDLRNEGRLTAEGVVVDVSCPNTGLELLDQNGTPVRQLRVEVGTIAAQSSARRIEVRAHVRRNLENSTATLKITTKEADFPATDHPATLTLVKEDVAIVSAVPPPLEIRSASRALETPATVSFRYEDGSAVEQETITLKFAVHSPIPLETVRLEQNGRGVNVGRAEQSQGRSVWQYAPQVSLDYGANTLEVVTVTAEGVRGVNRIVVNRRKPGKLWVAVVGISDYAHTAIPDLRFATADARAILDYYRQLGVPPNQLIELINEQATLTNVKRALGTELVSKTSNPDDTVILYFAGHGEREADPGSTDADGYSKYLLPYDANPADLFSSALSMEELLRILQRLRPERIALIIDSCFSGAAGGRTIFDPDVTRRAPVTDEFLSRMALAGKGRLILAASSGHEVAHEFANKGHGIFTYYVLQGLRGRADDDRDGNIDADELFKFVSQNVSVDTHGRQNPVRRAPTMTGTFILGKRTDD